MSTATTPQDHETVESVRIPVGSIEQIEADLILPAAATMKGIVALAHGSGSSRFSSRNRLVARRLREAHLGTLLLDLLTADEEEIDAHTAHLRFDIPLLASRLVSATDWLISHPPR